MTYSDWTKGESVAIGAVRVAATACRAVRQRLVSPETLEKRDRSPVTVADFASQAVVCARLENLDEPIVAEEDAAALRAADQSEIRQIVVEQVAAATDRPITEAQALDWIDHGSNHAEASSSSRFWTLDPIDGTKGFLRGGQYAIALALIDEYEVTFGVLGCPNLSLDGDDGVLFVAVRGRGAYRMSLWHDTTPQQIRVDNVDNTAAGRFCESVESGHSSHDDTAKIGQLLGISREPLRMDSQAKYATLAQGDASIYLRMPTSVGYREKIWDHAAGKIIVEEAGGVVTDVSGAPLDFSCGTKLQNNRGIVATNGKIHEPVIDAVRKVIGEGRHV